MKCLLENLLNHIFRFDPYCTERGRKSAESRNITSECLWHDFPFRPTTCVGIILPMLSLSLSPHWTHQTPLFRYNNSSVLKCFESRRIRLNRLWRCSGDALKLKHLPEVNTHKRTSAQEIQTHLCAIFVDLGNDVRWFVILTRVLLYRKRNAPATFESLSSHSIWDFTHFRLKLNGINVKDGAALQRVPYMETNKLLFSFVGN